MHKIEVRFSRNLARFAVSLFTGERIEIQGLPNVSASYASPSLRGSGLKSYLDTMAKTQGVSLLQKK